VQDYKFKEIVALTIVEAIDGNASRDNAAR